MSSFGESQGLGALTSWLPGFSKTDNHWAFGSETAVTKAMQAAESLRSGSTEYFE